MATTSNTFTGDNSTTNYSFTFEYLEQSEVKVTLDGVATTAFTFANATTLSFTSAPASGVEIRIYRDTNVDTLKATFFPGSAIKAEDLNDNFTQNNFAVQEIKNNTWDVDTQTIKSGETWVSNDAQIATTAAMDARFQDEAQETITSSETWPDDDDTIATTAAIDNRIDTAITNDIAGSDGVSITDDGDGTITVGLTDNSVDFDKIKDADQIQLADQVADPDGEGTDNNIFTARAATRRFNNYYQNDAPATTDGVGVGQIWVDPNDDLTLSVWSGSNWVGVTSGGTFTNQPKVIYVDANSGDDTNDGHRISRPKKTIAAALSDINSDSVYGDGSIVSVAPGIYAETLPLDIQKNDVGIIGQSLRTCIIHPKIPAADQSTYDVDVPHSQELQTMFRVNSGSYFTNLTLTGLKASGTRGGVGSLYTDSTYGLPVNQGWNFAFYPNAVIKKSPYIQNVTNFSDSQINNVTFTPHTPGEGAAGDLDSAPTGGGILVDGSVPATSSPLRSMVCDSYTHTALDGPGIFVTNNGYAQCTSSYAFFNHAHITCVNGGQANLAASTTDFGRFGLIADGKSSTAIFTSNVDGAASSGDTTFNINAPTAASDWFGSATRPANNMLVTVNSVTYPVLSATSYTDSEGGAGWTVTISRPDPTDTATNLGLNGAVSDDAAVSFFLRSMVASSGHTMEYVGSGTNYTALPENGGVPNDTNQIIERNDGKVWAATTDHKGTFKLGDFFTVDQQAGSLTVNSGSFQVDLGTLNVNVGGQAEVGADLDMGANELTSSTGDLKLQASGDINVQTNKIINVTDPTAAQDAATKAYVDNNTIGEVVDDASPQLGGNLDVNGYEILSTGNGDVTINPAGTGQVVLDANVKLPAGSASAPSFYSGTDTNTGLYFSAADEISVATGGTQRVVVNSSGQVGIGTSSPSEELEISSATPTLKLSDTDEANSYGTVSMANGDMYLQGNGASSNGKFIFRTGNAGTFTERMRIDSSGYVGLGEPSPDVRLHLKGAGSSNSSIRLENTSGPNTQQLVPGVVGVSNTGFSIYDVDNATTTFRIDDSGNVGIGVLPAQKLDILTGTYRGFFDDGASNSGFRIRCVNAGNTAAGPLQLGGDGLRFLSGPALPERARIDSSGNFGINTTSPVQKFEVIGNAFIGNGDYPWNTSNESGIFIGSGRFDAYKRDDDTSTFLNCIPIDSSNGSLGSSVFLVNRYGYVGVSVSSPTQKIDVDGNVLARNGTNTQGALLSNDGCLEIYRGNSNAFIDFKTGITEDFDCRIQQADNGLAFTTGGNGVATERMRITQAGHVTFAASPTLSAGSTGTVIYNTGLKESYIAGTTTTTHWSFINNNGQVGSITTNASATAYNTSSDYRLKENVVSLTGAADRLNQLQVHRFNFIADPDTTVDGFLAHEAQAIVPECVTGEKDEVDDEGNPVYQGIDQSKLVPLLTAALQEALAEIESLKARVTALEP